MALPHAILVSLCEQSGSGYELARRFDRSIGYFWAATHQQIYRTLRAMEDDGWVRVAAVAQHGRPDKREYTRVRRRRAELARWIAAPLPGGGNAVTDNRTRDWPSRSVAPCYGDIAALRAQVVALRAERTALLDAYRGFEKTSSPTLPP